MTFRRIQVQDDRSAERIAAALHRAGIFYYYIPYSQLHRFDIPNWETVEPATQTLIALLE